MISHPAAVRLFPAAKVLECHAESLWHHSHFGCRSFFIKSPNLVTAIGVQWRRRPYSITATRLWSSFSSFMTMRLAAEKWHNPETCSILPRRKNFKHQCSGKTFRCEKREFQDWKMACETVSAICPFRLSWRWDTLIAAVEYFANAVQNFSGQGLRPKV